MSHLVLGEFSKLWSLLTPEVVHIPLVMTLVENYSALSYSEFIAANNNNNISCSRLELKSHIHLEDTSVLMQGINSLRNYDFSETFS